MQEPTASEEGTAIHVLEDIIAGSEVTGLSFVPVTEDGRHAGHGMRGKTVTSWSNGAKKIKISDDATPQPLPTMKVCSGGLTRAKGSPGACELAPSKAAVPPVMPGGPAKVQTQTAPTTCPHAWPPHAHMSGGSGIIVS